jgi:quercetin dioxygenase-like cupin family protein
MKAADRKHSTPFETEHENSKKKKCIYPLAMECPTPDQPCIFARKKKKPINPHDSLACLGGYSMEQHKKQKATKKLYSEATRLTGLINYQEAAVVSRTLIDKKAGTVTLFAFDEKQGLSEHKAPFDAMVYVLDGEAEIIISSKNNRLKEGDMIIMPANEPHALKAVTRFKMVLTMIRS